MAEVKYSEHIVKAQIAGTHTDAEGKPMAAIKLTAPTRAFLRKHGVPCTVNFGPKNCRLDGQWSPSFTFPNGGNHQAGDRVLIAFAIGHDPEANATHCILGTASLAQTAVGAKAQKGTYTTKPTAEQCQFMHRFDIQIPLVDQMLHKRIPLQPSHASGRKAGGQKSEP